MYYVACGVMMSERLKWVVIIHTNLNANYAFWMGNNCIIFENMNETHCTWVKPTQIYFDRTYFSSSKYTQLQVEWTDSKNSFCDKFWASSSDGRKKKKKCCGL